MRAINEIDALGEQLAGAISAADWERAVELLVQRRAVLERAFADLPEDADEQLQLIELAETIMHADRELLAVSQQARRDTANDIRNLQRGRAAAEIYQANAQ